jgi:hypothetical protein
MPVLQCLFERNGEKGRTGSRGIKPADCRTGEAPAKKDAASLLAESEVLRADGVAKANKIIGDSLKGNEAYLRYLWIDKLDNKSGQVIYVPTEAGLPILEAGRLSHPVQ